MYKYMARLVLSRRSEREMESVHVSSLADAVYSQRWSWMSDVLPIESPARRWRSTTWVVQFSSVQFSSVQFRWRIVEDERLWAGLVGAPWTERERESARHASMAPRLL